jgi:sucrose-6-phosphate hydrolase SacC (GH32 family)
MFTVSKSGKGRLTMRESKVYKEQKMYDTKRLLMMVLLMPFCVLGCATTEPVENEMVENETFEIETPTMPDPIPDAWLTYHLAHPGPSKAVPGDPNCSIYYKGKYHMHYIYQSHGAAFAHVTSDDMVNWEWQETVLTEPLTGHGMFSGTAFLTKEGKAAIIYHGAGSDRNHIAFAENDALSQWTKTKVVDPRTADGKLAEMRHWDPDCWLMGDTYYALSGGEDPTVATSKDLKNWLFQGKLFHPDFPEDLGVAREEDISCANMFKIGDKWMMLCISHGLGARYYLGDFKDGQFQPYHHALLNWAAWDLFAPESLLTPDGRRVMWAWSTPGVFVDQRVERTKSFDRLMETLQSGIQSLPRELSLDDDGMLEIRPLRELAQLRTHQKEVRDITIKSGDTQVLEGMEGDTIELEVVFDAPQASEFGLRILANAKGENGFKIASGTDRETITLDYVEPPFKLKEGEDLTLRIFIDKGMIEVFVNDRQAAVAWHEYEPENQHIALYANGGEVKVNKVTCWSMKSIY